MFKIASKHKHITYCTVHQLHYAQQTHIYSTLQYTIFLDFLNNVKSRLLNVTYFGGVC